MVASAEREEVSPDDMSLRLTPKGHGRKRRDEIGLVSADWGDGLSIALEFSSRVPRESASVPLRENVKWCRKGGHGR